MDQRRINNKSIGGLGESAAAEYLESRGLRIAARNFRCGRLGEIDIIYRDGEYVCFVEVKTRSGRLYGLPCEAVTRSKQQNIYRIAQVYLKQNNLTHENIRFDVCEVFIERKDQEIKIRNLNYIPNAF